MKRTIIAFLIFSLLFSLASCGDTRDFTHCEITLTLPKVFSKHKSDEPFVIRNSDGERISFLASGADSYDLLLCDGELAVMLRRISHEAALDEAIPPFLTQLEFARYYKSQLEKSPIECSNIEHFSQVPYFTYTREGDGDSFSFLLAFLNSRDAYFIITFVCTEDNYTAMKPTVSDYLENVSFS